MANLPIAVTAYLSRISIAARTPAYLLVSADGSIAEAGGQLGHYRLAVTAGQSLPEPWVFLHDFLTLDEESLDLPCVQVGTGVLVDIHLLRDDHGVWIILLDATVEEHRQRLVQQKTNELSLLEAQRQKLLGQYVGAGIAETLLQHIWDPSSEGERRVLTVLFADLCGFTSYCEARPPGRVFRTLNAYLGAMIDPVTAHGGFIDKLIGDEVMGLFGVLPVEPEQPAAAVQAVLAAQKIVHSVRAQHKKLDLDIALEVSVGIATGPVALGILGTKERRSFTVIGHHVNLAARLVAQAEPGEILMDEATYQSLGGSASQAQPRALMLKGLATPMVAYAVSGQPMPGMQTPP